jgi:uncharacterized protein
MWIERPSFTSFVWDNAKRASNIAKHGIDFEDALLALQQPHIEILTAKGNETRILAICPESGRLIAVVYTMRGDACRIISARAAHRDEQRLYHTHIPR